jgi:F-type H+-transporting ATPase subunit gamma
MATLKQVEQRIKSTANIAKITGAMKMVAAAKLRSAEERLNNTRPLTNMVEEFAGKVVVEESKSTTFVPITTDRGLCGGVNSNLVKELARELVPAEEAKGAECQVVCVGEKGRAQLNRFIPGHLKKVVGGVFAQVLPNFGQASVCAEEVMEHEADKYSILYNKFVNKGVQVPARIDLPSAKAMVAMDTDPLMDYEQEWTREELAAKLCEFNLATGIYAGMVDNQCSEIASRMSAMDNAARNCESLVEKLQTQYNKARQAVITTELIEIISGAESLKG